MNLVNSEANLLARSLSSASCRACSSTFLSWGKLRKVAGNWPKWGEKEATQEHELAKHSLDQLGSAWISLPLRARNFKKQSVPQLSWMPDSSSFLYLPRSAWRRVLSRFEILAYSCHFYLRLSIRFEEIKDIQRLQSVGTEPRDPRNPSKKHWNSREKESLLCRFNGASTVLCRCSKAWRADLMQASSESETIHKLTNSETNWIERNWHKWNEKLTGISESVVFDCSRCSNPCSFRISWCLGGVQRSKIKGKNLVEDTKTIVKHSGTLK